MQTLVFYNFLGIPINQIVLLIKIMGWPIMQGAVNVVGHAERCIPLPHGIPSLLPACKLLPNTLSLQPLLLVRTVEFLFFPCR